MARGRPHGRSKSDHRVCQEARYARAAQYRERITISAEQQEARIAAVNAECNVEHASRRRRRRESRELKTKAGAARMSAGSRACKLSGGGKKKAKKGLEYSLGKAAERDPHILYCHECGATAEFGLRGGKKGGEVIYFCRGHTPMTGCFRIDRDHKDWAEEREMRFLRAEERRLEEELRNLGRASSAAEPAAAWNDFQSKGVWASMHMSPSLIATLLMIGGVERNPGPTTEEIALRESWRDYDLRIKSRLLDHLARKEFELADWEKTPPDDRSGYLTRWRNEYKGPGEWADGWEAFLKAVPVVKRGQDAGQPTDVGKRDADQENQNRDPSSHAKPNFKRSTYLDTSETGVLAKGLVKRRKVELEQAGKGVFEIGWSILPQAEPLGVRDLRFLVLTAEEKRLGVAVMGRSHFRRLVDRAIQLMDGELPGGGRRILMHGPAGFGKTHLLLQLIIYLTAALEAKQQRVAPLLDCAFFKADEVEAMKQALAWAYAGEREIVKTIASLETMRDVKAFLSGRKQEILFCLDQYQELLKDSEAKQKLDGLLYHFRTILVTSAGGEELTTENETLHGLASRFPVHSGLTQEEQKSFDIIYGTECTTPAVQRLVREKLGGVAGCLADWYEAYYGKPPGGHSVYRVFGQSPAFQVGPLEPVKEGELDTGVLGGESKLEGSQHLESQHGLVRKDIATASKAPAVTRGKESAIRVEELLEEELKGSGFAEVTKSEQTTEKLLAEERDWKAWETFLEGNRVLQISRGLKRIYDKVRAKGANKVQEWIDQMKKMVYTDSFVEFDLTDWNDIDLRYVAVEGHKVRPAYPLVRDAIAHFVEQVQGRAVFYSDQAVWASLSQELGGERVPAVAGLLTERCAIGAIVDGLGYKAVLKMEKKEQVKLVFFKPNGEASAVFAEQDDFRKSGLEMRIACFVPRSPFYPAMDMALLVFKKPKGQPGSVERLTKVQMTLESAREHGHSTRTAMHISNVEPWLGKANLDSVTVEFCYIVPGDLVTGGVPRHTEQIPAKMGVTRAQAGSIQIVAHTHVELAFGQLDERLGQVDKWNAGKVA
ncbi:hypothetical protein KFL_002940140 [Klebsormidium nitens]|uniref:Uncharacterized protein n=1 Tax=Klebsormidium nitens TaxID=105231 RepID=A0A1Y1IEJ1_KLENI|nr:hypothetical protein KFL_002940140 [Klebsormidium nitens]|eukprot:GAQ86528.1 hypothetical protein KFL_002940140 [Klebsormidium nitens]